MPWGHFSREKRKTENKKEKGTKTRGGGLDQWDSKKIRASRGQLEYPGRTSFGARGKGGGRRLVNGGMARKRRLGRKGEKKRKKIHGHDSKKDRNKIFRAGDRSSSKETSATVRKQKQGVKKKKEGGGGEKPLQP